ncbi:MAG: hypothetical protein HYV14_07740 [Elusimicrobia bacterium]|nr:hypothetical protein [Elusimicrobiota bacterium]
MKSLMSFVFLMPMILAAAPSRALSVPAVVDDRCREEYCPQPYPRPGSCPKGTHRVFDEYKGRYICVEDDAREPRPLPWRTDRMKELSGVLGGDDMSAKGAALNGLFDAVQSRESDAGAVTAGAWGAAPSGVAALKPYDPKKGARLILVGEKGAAAGAIAGGAAGEMTGVPGAGSVGAGLGGLAGSKAEDKFNSGMDKLGDRLRDRNDEKLRQGTQAQKDAEARYPKK